MTDSANNSPITIRFVKGLKNKQATKTFKNEAALEKWLEKNGDDVEILAYAAD